MWRSADNPNKSKHTKPFYIRKRLSPLARNLYVSTPRQLTPGVDNQKGVLYSASLGAITTRMTCCLAAVCPSASIYVGK